MLKTTGVAFVTVLAMTSVAHAQPTGNRAPRFGAALGLVTPGAMPPQAATGSLSAVLVRRDGNPFQLQVDATSFLGSGFASAATATLVYHRRIRGVATYGLAGSGYSNFAHHPRIVTGGIGALFPYGGRALFSEFRVYYPRQDLLSGIRVGLRF